MDKQITATLDDLINAQSTGQAALLGAPLSSFFGSDGTQFDNSWQDLTAEELDSVRKDEYTAQIEA